MGKQLSAIDSELTEWISRQKIFFVATAPNTGGHINCSPKGGDSFRVLNSTKGCYADLTGSGAETIAHLKENGRLVVMFCSFEGSPKIVRLHGLGKVIEPQHVDFPELISKFPENPGTRSIVMLNVTRISSSCGYAVPLFDFRGERDALDKWAVAKGVEGLRDYRRLKNQKSIDGLPALGGA